jgi:hypothetical protein
MSVDIFIGMNNACLFYMHSHETYSSCGLSIEAYVRTRITSNELLVVSTYRAYLFMSGK